MTMPAASSSGTDSNAAVMRALAAWQPVEAAGR